LDMEGHLSLLEKHTGTVQYVILTDDGRAVSASEDHSLRVWDLASGQCLKVLEGHTDIVNHVALTGDGRAVSASRDNSLRVWDLTSGRCLKVLKGHHRAVDHVALTRDGQAVSESYDQDLRVWNLNTGQCVEVYQKGSHEALIWKSRYLPDPPDVEDSHWILRNQYIYFASSENALAIYPGNFRFKYKECATSARCGIFFSGGEPHILHLHGPGIDEPEVAD